MTGGRAAPTRAEVVTTVVVLLLAAAAVVALWPRGGPVDARPGASSITPAVVSVPDTELAPLRAAAGLAPCPAGTGAEAPAGPLTGVSLPCLGAPGDVDLDAVGRPLLLNVWASWCAPCRDELPVLAEYAARPGAVPVLGVDVRDDPRPALRLLADLRVTLPSVTDPDNALREALNLPPALPISYLVRADGSVAMVDPPVPFATADAVAAAVARLG